MSSSRFVATIVALTLSAVLAGCSSGYTAVGQTIADAFGPTKNVEPQLNPRFAYLRATVQGRAAFLALGVEEAAPGGSVKYWYSADREMLVFQNGRVVEASGLTTEWRKVTLDGVPSWRAAAAAPDGVVFTRTRDVMPGYRYGVEDRLSLRRIDVPRSTRLLRVDAAQLTWFEERITRTDGGPLPAAIYGVDLRDGREEVVYGEQCLAPELCFTWQKWPVTNAK